MLKLQSWERRGAGVDVVGLALLLLALEVGSKGFVRNWALGLVFISKVVEVAV